MAETTESTHGLDPDALEAARVGLARALGGRLGAMVNGVTDKRMVHAVLTAYFGALEEGERVVAYMPSHWRDTLDEYPDAIVGVTLRPDDAEEWKRVEIYPGPIQETTDP